MFDCSTDRYGDLYAPWIRRGSLILEGESLTNSKVLDLCGGTGNEAKRALAVGAQRVVLLDLNPRCEDGRIEKVRGRAEEASRLVHGHFDRVYCRQAMGYLEPALVAREVSRLLEDGGVFIFNTFHKPKRYNFKSYQLDGTVYDEGHLFLFGRVFHVQHKIGCGADVSMFRYHDPKVLLDAMTPYFHSVEATTLGKACRWTCTKRNRR